MIRIGIKTDGLWKYFAGRIVAPDGLWKKLEGYGWNCQVSGNKLQAQEFGMMVLGIFRERGNSRSEFLEISVGYFNWFTDSQN